MENNLKTAVPANRSAWGMSPGDVTGPTWGARAIYTENRNAYKHNHTKTGAERKRGRVPYFNLDIPHDRMGVGPEGTEAEHKAMAKWLDKTGLPALREACEKQWVTPDSDKEVRISLDGYVLRGCPRKSHGYLYLVCHLQGQP